MPSSLSSEDSLNAFFFFFFFFFLRLCCRLCGERNLSPPTCLALYSLAPCTSFNLNHHSSSSSSSSSSNTKIMTNKMMLVVDYVVKLAYLSGFSMMGMLIRYHLGVLFETFLRNTNELNTPLFVDLPANMVGSFFMGWVGIVWMDDISNVFSQDVTKGISMGLIGSITTFSSWNQRMVELATAGQWRSSLICYLIGMGLAQMSLEVGVKLAKELKKLLMGTNSSLRMSEWGDIEEGGINMKPSFTLHGHGHACSHMLIRVVGLIVGIGGWMGAIGMSLWDEDTTRRTLWLACVTVPPGVISRWYLSFLNHDNRITHWLPIGTLSANLMATSLHATFGVIVFMVKDRDVRLLMKVEELGLLGCMSSTSTFVAELHSIYAEASLKRALAYALVTLLSAMLLGFFIYFLPTWWAFYVANATNANTSSS